MKDTNFKKESHYKVTTIDGKDSFIGRYELTTESGFFCFWNIHTGEYGYVDPQRVFEIKELPCSRYLADLEDL